MDDGVGTILGAALVLGIIFLFVYVVTMIAAAVVGVAAAAGSLWGGGWAFINYGKSFKENIIDSNRAES
jgi:hypothetical protein